MIFAQREGIVNVPMPSGQNEGMANFPYQTLLVSFHLQYRNAIFYEP